MTGVADLRWDADGRVVYADGVPISWVWKTLAWKTVIDQIRAECDDDAEDLRLHRPRDLHRSPRLANVLLRKEVRVFEPLWTLIPSNKAILPVLWSMYPNHPYLLEARFDLTEDLRENGYAAKPIVGRCGSNISIFDRDSGLIGETSGGFGDRNQVYQVLFPLPVIDGRYVQIGTFSVGWR